MNDWRDIMKRFLLSSALLCIVALPNGLSAQEKAPEVPTAPETPETMPATPSAPEVPVSPVEPAVPVPPVPTPPTTLEPIVGTIPVTPDTDISTIPTIGEAEASRIALEKYPGAEIDDVDLEVEDGYLVFEVEVDNDTTKLEVELLIDAGNGKILRTEIEDVD